MSYIFTMRVYTEDTDHGGIVYHANYLKFFERARSEWVEELGFGIEFQRHHKIYFPVRYAKIDYLKPARLHQMLEVVTEIREKRVASIIFDQHIRLKDSPEMILCKAEIKIACVGYDFKPRELP